MQGNFRHGLRIGYNRNQLSGNRPLSDEEIRSVVPSVYAEGAHVSRSDAYRYIPTGVILAGLRQNGFEPFFAAQSKTRDANRKEYTKHVLRLRHMGYTGTPEDVNEIILLNSHDGSSSYKLLAGKFRFFCFNGLVCGEMYSDVTVPHKGANIQDRVIEGAYTVIETFKEVDTSRDAMKALILTEPEQELFARSALQLRWQNQHAPVRTDSLLQRRRAADMSQDLWTTFNVVQENAVRGGLHGRDRANRRQTTREIRGIDQNTALNRALWSLAEGMRALKEGRSAA